MRLTLSHLRSKLKRQYYDKYCGDRCLREWIIRAGLCETNLYCKPKYRFRTNQRFQSILRPK